MADVFSESKELCEKFALVYVHISRESEPIDDSKVIKDTLWVCERRPPSARLPPVH